MSAASTPQQIEHDRPCSTCRGEERCARCLATAPPEARFCASCGAALARTSAAESEAGERRQLTVLFCDLVGSTDLAMRLDPEDWQAVLRAHHRRAGEVVARHGGHVAQYLGDGLLAYFGWPTAYDDAAERAVHAALALVDAATARDPSGPALAVRVGIDTGPVVVSALGAEGRTEMLALGDVPNVAARVQGAAEPGTVLVTGATQRLVAGRFEVEQRAASSLRTVRAPLALYRVLRPSRATGRIGAHGGRLTRFVGREVEIATLLERWERAGEGQGQSVLVSGEPGVGKSRLVHELRERLAGEPHVWLECHATPYTQATPFRPLLALASQALNIAPGDTAETRRARLEHGLRELASAEAVALLATVLGFPPATPLAMSPDLQRRMTIDLLARWILAQGASRPLVVAVEDLHWCDASSLEVLGRLVEQSATARVLVVMTARPELAPPWASRESSSTLSLARLTRRQAREMIAALGGADLPAATLDALIARADGVPLFVEELARAVAEPGAAHQAHAIPATLADSLMARLDRLATAKDVAQHAAVLGREFPYALLAAVSDLDEEALRRSLARLVEAEILFVRGEPPAAIYTFKHALVQEAAYASLLKRRRQRLHGRVVDALQADFPERAADEPELVARHAEAAGRIGDAIVAYHRAGEAAQLHSAHQESMRHFEHAIALLVTRPALPGRDGCEAALQIALAESRAVALGYTSPEVEAAHERTRVLCEATGDTRGLGFALSRLAVFAHNCGQAERACELATRALAIGEQVADPELLLKAHCDLGLAEVYRGRFASSLGHLEAALHLHQPGVEHARLSATGNPGVRALSASAWDLFVLGFPDRALARAKEAVVRARELAHPFSVAHALFFETVAHALRRDVAAQRDRAAEAIALSEAQGFPFWLGVGTMFHAAARVASGERGAVADLRAGFALTAGTGSRGGAPAMIVLLGEAYLAAGQLAEARAAVEGGLALSAQMGQPFFDAELHRLRGEIALAAGAPAEDAIEAFRRALAVARAQEAKSFELRGAICLARLWHRRGEDAQARALLAPLHAWFSEGFETRDLVVARVLLDELG